MALGQLGKTDPGLNVCFLNLKHVGPGQDWMQSDCKEQKSGKKLISKI